MTSVLILGTDTDAGKTTLALLWLANFADKFEYWKPLETGASDSERVEQLLPDVVVHPPVKRLAHPLAPPRAAKLENDVIPAGRDLLRASPAPRDPRRGLLIETFGSPFSPLNEEELQINWIELLRLPAILVSSSSLGAIGRTLQTITALAARGLEVAAIALVGPHDPYAEAELRKHQEAFVVSLQPPTVWNSEELRKSAQAQRHSLVELANAVRSRCPGRMSDLQERDRSVIWHPYTSLLDSEPPLEVVAAQDEFLELADGRRLIDGISSWWTILHGHRHPPLMAALSEAARSIDHVHFAGVTHASAIELAELLLSTAPWPDGRVFYSDNGSTAVEVALKMAYQFWCHRGEAKRTLFAGFEGGYHGDTFGAMAVSRDPIFFGRFEPLLFRAEILPLSPDALDQWLTVHQGEAAGVILEPLVQGAGGMRMHSPETLRQIFEIVRKHGVLFIADEVMTGGGRTGWLWAHQAAKIAPDLICAAKTLAGGVLPLAATLVAPDIVAAFATSDRARTFFHGHSFTAHPLACAVAAANWRKLARELPTAPGRFEAFWKERFLALTELPQVQEVRILGTIAVVELKTGGGYLAEIGPMLRRCCLDGGVLLRPLGAVLYAMPPFCTSPASLERIARAMHSAVRAVAHVT